MQSEQYYTVVTCVIPPSHTPFAQTPSCVTVFVSKFSKTIQGIKLVRNAVSIETVWLYFCHSLSVCTEKMWSLLNFTSFSLSLSLSHKDAGSTDEISLFLITVRRFNSERLQTLLCRFFKSMHPVSFAQYTTQMFWYIIYTDNLWYFKITTTNFGAILTEDSVDDE